MSKLDIKLKKENALYKDKARTNFVYVLEGIGFGILSVIGGTCMTGRYQRKKDEEISRIRNSE